MHTDFPFPDAAFDIVDCHQMLTHLKAPWTALHEMVRVTKPAGIVAAREGDLETQCFWPALLGLSKFQNFAAGLMSAAGGTLTGVGSCYCGRLRRVSRWTRFR